MKLKSLAITTLLVLGCSGAFGQTYTFGFLTSDGTPSCDYETFTVSGSFAAGTHVLTPCGLPFDAVMVGLKQSIPLKTGLPVTGAVVVMADNSYDAEFDAFTGCQIDWVTKTKASSKKFGWEFFFTCGGNTEYLGNWGYLSNKVDAAKRLGATRTAFGAIPAAARKKR